MDSAPILRLPSEILIKVLSYVVGDRPPGVCLWYTGEVRSQWCGPRRLPTDRYTSMLLVCSAFYHAGIEAYYGGVVFKFLSVEHLRAVTSTLGVDRKRCIQNIIINIEFDIDRKLWYTAKKLICNPRTAQDLETDALAELPGLQRVKINVGVPHVSDKKTIELQCRIERTLNQAWRSKADAIVIEWFWRPSYI